MPDFEEKAEKVLLSLLASKIKAEMKSSGLE
jgi:hypothetical protein